MFFKNASCVVLRGVWFLMFFSDAVAQSVAFVNIANVAMVCAWRIVSVSSVIAQREHVFSMFFNYASCVVMLLFFDVYHGSCRCAVHIFDYYQFSSVSLPL